MIQDEFTKENGRTINDLEWALRNLRISTLIKVSSYMGKLMETECIHGLTEKCLKDSG